MNLSDLLVFPHTVSGDAAKVISGLSYDSRATKPGDLFFAVRGETADGHDYIGQALERGAAAIVHDHAWPDPGGLRSACASTAWIAVDDVKDAMAAVSHGFYGRPSEHLFVTGITGTNGKTTTAILLSGILEAGGADAGLIGTIRYAFKGRNYPAPHTTPEAPDFQRLLHDMSGAGCRHVVTEVSSHALAQKRVDHTRFRVAVFTNLSRDHLDYHRTMEAYASAKMRLFTELLPSGGGAVLNVDDPFGQELAESLRSRDITVITYGINNSSAGLRAENVETDFRGTSFRMKGAAGDVTLDGRITTRLIGTVNVSNILAASGAALFLGVPFDIVRHGIAGSERVNGRLDVIKCGRNITAIIDYAHTEDAIEKLLRTVRDIRDQRSGKDIRTSRGRIITVFGCGGNRDRGKRPKMGESASRLSDLVIITSDNPRNEDPVSIIREIEQGMTGSNYVVIPDRALAIGFALREAAEGDIVIVAGKGHEDYQEIRGKRFPFSDPEVLRKLLKTKNRSTSVRESVPC